jgi:hypothetical protein
LWALLALNDLELNAIAFGQGLEAVPLDGAEVNEDVWPPLVGDEAVALRVVEPLHGAGKSSHCTYLFQESVILDPVPEALETQLASVIHPRLATLAKKIGQVAWKAVEASFVQAKRRRGRRLGVAPSKSLRVFFGRLYAAPAM